MPHPQRAPRFNAKARGSVAGGKKGKGKGKGPNRDGHADAAVTLRSSAVSMEADPNADIITPKTKEEKDRDRKERMREELLAAAPSKMTSKKKRRLDKYIDKKLKKEERVVIFQKLSESQAQVSNSLSLHSSSMLGSGKLLSNAERLSRDEDKQLRRALESKGGKRRRSGASALVPERDLESSGEDEDIDEKGASKASNSRAELATDTQEEESEEDDLVAEPVKPLPTIDTKAAGTTPAAVGSALRRNPDGSVVAPRIVPRKRKGTRKFAFQGWKSAPVEEAGSDSDASSSSFDSSASSGEDGDDDDDNDEDENKSQSSSENDEDSEEGDELPKVATGKRKRSGFKEWAQKQIIASQGLDAADSSSTTASRVLPATPALPYKSSRALELETSGLTGPMGEVLAVPQTSFAQHLRDTKQTAPSPRRFVNVERSEDIQNTRLLLPIVTEEQPIMEAIMLNPVVIICGETGSGKTTQVPQFLYEAGFGSPGSDNPGMIGITQPRRVAAMSMASRVAQELSLPASRVSYQIRYDATTSPTTSIKFMTDGVLLRELATDFLLSRYSVIIVDEAHERSMNTDILIGVLSRVIKLREEMWKKKEGDVKPLRLIIMSATLRVSDFAGNTTLFPVPPPIINVPGRQHPVTIHFNRRTTADYVAEAVRKAIKIHARLPAGAILIFLTGQDEINTVCRRLEKKFGRKALDEKRRRRAAGDKVAASKDEEDGDNIPTGPKIYTDVKDEAENMRTEIPDQDIPVDLDDTGAVDPDALDSDDGESEAEDDIKIDMDDSDGRVPMHILPLYSLLPSDQQMKVFQPPPSGSRLVVVATNVAETSLTIPGVRYVVDCGRSKERKYDVTSGIQAFQIAWTSKASANQRAGRAGRTGPGHCYRLYSSSLFENHFDQFADPEINRVPIEGVVLQMKSMHIDAVVNFPFPTPPDRTALRKAETILSHLGALEASAGSSTSKTKYPSAQSSTIGGHITDLGRSMSLFPVSPRFAKMLVAGRQNGCLPYVIAIVSGLSVGDPFLREDALNGKPGDDTDVEMAESNPEIEHIRSEDLKAKEKFKLQRRAFFQIQQTHSALGNSSSDAFRILSVAGAYEYEGGGLNFCARHFVRPKAMEEIHKLRAQITNIVSSAFPDAKTEFTPKLPPPSESQLKVLRQLIASAFIDQVAIRKDLVDKTGGSKFASARGVPYQAMGISEDVYIHPSSVVFHNQPPEFVVFQEVVRTNRVWIKSLTIINPAWLPVLGRSLCTFSKPIEQPLSMKGTRHLVVIPRFGPGWELRPIALES
ncbi:hypothetical protein BOTBODRAFT_177247 [Botryobasidium botryosum FD-172 SS1]|uniref:RNA helicase n=1 Tax=Botryobasidium botryosum (strain FD-172 SS1) TaxID=930990 RepID=A0A067M6M1_BOTB1|nr:hypothetical protein BOTBODRAFT_177247 [Botryobasidium botryosum FD-172 SS1]